MLKILSRKTLVTCCLTAAVAGGVVTTPLAFAQNQPAERGHKAGDKQAADGKQMSVEQCTAEWKAGPQKAAKMMTEKYGEPSGMTPTRLIWTDKGPFKEIILINEEIQHDFPVPHKDYLQHVVEFKVPTDKIGELAEFDGSIIVDRTRGTIGARCDIEAHNLLALNLAYDVINGKKNAEEARKEFGEIVKAEMAGKKHDYLSKLTFQPMPKAGDADTALMKGKPGEAQPAAAQE